MKKFIYEINHVNKKSLTFAVTEYGTNKVTKMAVASYPIKYNEQGRVAQLKCTTANAGRVYVTFPGRKECRYVSAKEFVERIFETSYQEEAHLNTIATLVSELASLGSIQYSFA